MTMSNKIGRGDKRCTSVAGHFEGHAGVRVPCHVYCPMQHVQGCTRCCWKLPSGKYLLRIAPAPAEVKGKKTMTKHSRYLLANLMAMTMRPYNIVRITQERRFRALTEATGCRHWATGHSYTNFCCCFFIINLLKKSSRLRQDPY